jgi:hypothetical protein
MPLCIKTRNPKRTFLQEYQKVRSFVKPLYNCTIQTSTVFVVSVALIVAHNELPSARGDPTGCQYGASVS